MTDKTESKGISENKQCVASFKTSDEMMDSSVSVFTLSRDEKYERSIKFFIHRRVIVRDVKNVIAETFRLKTERFDLFRLAEGVLLEDGFTEMSETDWKSGLCLIIHPERRDPLPNIVTEKEDMINGIMEDEPRILMSCGHAITPETLYEYCWNMLKQKKTEFTCPSMDTSNMRRRREGNVCNSQWTLYEITLKARMSVDERVLFEMMLSRNKLDADKDVQQCPFCGTVSSRINENNSRVRCLTCTQRNPNRCEFCWKCLHEWKTQNAEHCGNLDCAMANGPKAIQDILSTCGTKNIDTYRGVPKIRFCIGCKALVEHISGCKRMPCKNCKTQFCFVCLKMWSADGCGYNKTCKIVAGIQTFQ